MSILEKLRAACLPMHRQLEDRLDLMARVKTRDDYAGLLQKFYAFVRPLEQKLAGVAGLDKFNLDLPARLKTPRLEKDLGSLAAEKTAAAPNVPDIGSLAAAMGCLYVMEGSTLGGQVLSRHFKTLFGPEAPVAYLGGYGAETGPRWKTFLSALGQAYDSAPGEVQDEVVRAAQGCFAAMGDALA